MDVTIKTNRHVVAGAGHNGILQAYCKSFFQECADIAIKECRTKVQHVLLNQCICRQLALCDLNSTECRYNLLCNLAVYSTPGCSLYRMVIQDPSGHVCNVLEVDGTKQRMLCHQILVDILNDGDRHDFCIQKACINLFRMIILAGLNECLIIFGLISCELTETTLCKDSSVTVCGLKVCSDGSSNGLTKLIKRCLHCFRSSIFRIECSLKSYCSFCNHRILSQHFLIPPSSNN